MPEPKRNTEDERAREHLGLQVVLSRPGQKKMTPQADEQTPKSGESDGHVA